MDFDKSQLSASWHEPGKLLNCQILIEVATLLPISLNIAALLATCRTTDQQISAKSYNNLACGATLFFPRRSQTIDIL